MTPEEYAARQAVITSLLVVYLQKFIRFFLPQPLSPAQWVEVLQFVWPEVEKARLQSAALGRKFYDLERDKYYPDAPNLARELERYKFDWFVKDMEPVRKQLSQADAPRNMVDVFALQAARVVENGARRQIIFAVEDDDLLVDYVEGKETALVDRWEGRERPNEQLVIDTFIKELRTNEPSRDLNGRVVRGWARVATGRETCAWCLMLVSRGPVYQSASTAGLDLPDTDAVHAIYDEDDVSDSMNEWHPGCDCKVVPVFDYKNWVGKDAQKKAEALWIDATGKARRELDEHPDKKYYSFNDKQWQKTTLGRETINQLRKMIDAGEVNPLDWSALAVA